MGLDEVGLSRMMGSTKEPKLTSAMRILPEWTGLNQKLEYSIGSHSNSNNERSSIHKHSEL